MTDFDKRLEIIMLQEKNKLIGKGIKPGNVVSIKSNSRLRRKLGQCLKKPAGIFEIEIARFLENSSEAIIREVVMHELLHSCRGCFNHGKKWKMHAELINEEYGYNISRLYKDDKDEPLPERKYKYVIKCTSCGNKGYRLKRSKVIGNPQNYKCSKCGGKIVVEEI